MLNVFLQMIIENTVIPEMNATIYFSDNLFWDFSTYQSSFIIQLNDIQVFTICVIFKSQYIKCYYYKIKQFAGFIILLAGISLSVLNTFPCQRKLSKFFIHSSVEY